MTDELDFLQSVMGRISEGKRPAQKLRSCLAMARQGEVPTEEIETQKSLLLELLHEAERAAPETDEDDLGKALTEAVSEVIVVLLDGWLLLEESAESPDLLEAVVDRADAADEALAQLQEDLQELASLLPEDDA